MLQALPVDSELILTTFSSCTMPIDFQQLHIIRNCHQDSVNCLSFSPDGRFLASGGEDGALFVFDYKNGCDVWKITHPSSLTCLVWHPSNEGLYAGFGNGDVQRFDPASSLLCHVYNTLKSFQQVDHSGSPIPLVIQDPIECIAFNFDKSYLAVGSVGKVTVCRVSKKRKLRMGLYLLLFLLIVCHQDIFHEILVIRPSHSNDQPHDQDVVPRTLHFMRGGHFLVISYLEHGIMYVLISSLTYKFSYLLWKVLGY